ncbi:hypothetical protein [Nocardiopsis sp. YSL2]|uniref:hypothetical protein n=1 Tax=Nocardiopsis sp. YSL2 TaxID=2939492 RepID=UPI0026F474F3|nr:hypothetical protein [Nocardiopsis sp. YSL2]
MNQMRWIGAVVAGVAIVAALGAGLWFGGGPTSRGGWEAASWAAGITAALALVANVLVWATTARNAPPAAPGAGNGGGVVNSVNGDVSGGTVVQGRDMHVDDFPDGT